MLAECARAITQNCGIGRVSWMLDLPAVRIIHILTLPSSLFDPSSVSSGGCRRRGRGGKWQQQQLLPRGAGWRVDALGILLLDQAERNKTRGEL